MLRNAEHFSWDITLTHQTEKEPKSDLDSTRKKEVVFHPYDPWDTRFQDEKRRLGSAE